MFAATHPTFRTAPALAHAYMRVGVESASPHKLVMMLFDGFQDSVAQARAALRSQSIELKGRAIRRALGILDDGLLGGLDLKAGGQVASNLAALYTYVSLRLTHANIRNDEAALDECVRLMEPIRTAWAAIGPQVNGFQQ